MASAVIETGYPCWHCGVNQWTDCKHRKAESEKPEVLTRKKKVVISGGGAYRIPSRRLGNGRNFKHKLKK